MVALVVPLILLPMPMKSSDNNNITAPEMSLSVENIPAIIMSVVLSIELENWMVVAPLERGEKPDAGLW